MGIDYYRQDECRRAYERYRALRRTAYELTLSQLRDMGFLPAELLRRVHLQDISTNALQQAASWHWYWDWPKQHRKFSRYPDAIRTALWHEETLCGLALGRVSKGKLFIRVHYLQGADGDNPLKGKVAAILLLSAEQYGLGLGVKTITIESPIEDVIPHYQSFGFALVEGKRECRMVKVL